MVSLILLVALMAIAIAPISSESVKVEKIIHGGGEAGGLVSDIYVRGGELGGALGGDLLGGLLNIGEDSDGLLNGLRRVVERRGMFGSKSEDGEREGFVGDFLGKGGISGIAVARSNGDNLLRRGEGELSLVCVSLKAVLDLVAGLTKALEVQATEPKLS